MSFEHADLLADPHNEIDLDQIDGDEALPPTNEYREASRKFLRIICQSLAYVTESTSPQAAAWSVCYALGLPVCEGVSMANRASMLGISPQAFSKQIKNMSDTLGTETSSYQYNK